MRREYLTNMYYTYVLRSRDFGKHYVGHCENLVGRIQEHNSGKTRSIKPYIPYDLIYFEEFEERADAIRREKYFKSGSGREYLNKLLIHAPVVQLDRISDFGSDG